MIDLCNKLIDNNLSRKDLLKKVEIRKTSVEDFESVCKTLAKAFGLSSEHEAAFQLMNSSVKLDESIKLVDKETNDIYGLLMFCEFPLKIGSPIMMVQNKLGKFLDKFSQINGHSFVIDERLRGCGIDKKMLYFNSDFIRDNYDMLWIGVEKSLKSLPYWHKLGFINIFETNEATFLMIPLSKKIIKETIN